MLCCWEVRCRGPVCGSMLGVCVEGETGEGRVLIWSYGRRRVEVEEDHVFSPRPIRTLPLFHSQLKTAGWKHTGAAGHTFKSIHLQNEERFP